MKDKSKLSVVSQFMQLLQAGGERQGGMAGLNQFVTFLSQKVDMKRWAIKSISKFNFLFEDFQILIQTVCGRRKHNWINTTNPVKEQLCKKQVRNIHRLLYFHQYFPFPENWALHLSPPAPLPQKFPAVPRALPALPQGGRHLMEKLWVPPEDSLTLQTSSQTRRVCPPALRLSLRLTMTRLTYTVAWGQVK